MTNLILGQVVDACEGKYFGDESALKKQVEGIVIDNRSVLEGFLFVPIKGDRFDGHEFIESAYDAGALCCLSENEIEGRPYILVKSTQLALQEIAKYYRQLFDLCVIGITGSAGKTTTKEMIASVLSQRLNVLKTQGNFNNQTGVPLTLFRLKKENTAAVVEMGMNHFGEIEALSKMAQPNFCFITNIGTAHIEHLGSREGIFEAKCEMMAHMKKGGKVFVNGDDNLLATLKQQRDDVITYGLSEDNDYYAKDITEKGLQGSEFSVVYGGGEFKVFVPAPGKYMILNALAAVCAGVALGLSEEEIANGINTFEPVGQRMRIAHDNRPVVLSDVYNANPNAMKEAIDVLCMAKGRKVCVLGDMLELGEHSADLHLEVGEYAIKKGVDLLLCVGEHSAKIAQGANEAGGKAVWYGTQEELKEQLFKHIEKEDFVLVKGSRGMQLEQTVNLLLNSEK